MQRRELLAATAGLATTAAAGCAGLGASTADDDGGEDGPVPIETVDAPGSEPGVATVPEPGRVTFLEFFATTCDVCASQMPELAHAYRRADADVQFLSVTSEPVGLSVSKEELASWWADHGGEWPVAVDDGVTLARRYDATSVPTAVVIAPGGAVTWSRSGRVSASTIVGEVRSARAGEGS